MYHYHLTFLLSLIALIGAYPLTAQTTLSTEIQSETDSVTASTVELTTLKVQYLLNRSNPVAPLPKEVLPTTLLLQTPLSSAVSVIPTIQSPELSIDLTPSLVSNGDPLATALHREELQLPILQQYYERSLQSVNQLKLAIPTLITRREGDLLAHRIDMTTVGSSKPAVDAAINTPFAGVNASDQLHGVTLGRKYWFPGLESNIQFSQTYISPNWHKGGNSALALHSKQLLRLSYEKDKVNWLNELEWRIGLNAEIRDSLQGYNISDDLLRLRSNLGIKAFKGWYYSLDVEARTQAFEQKSEDKTVIYSAFASPLTLTAGLGMKWVVDNKSKTHYGRRFRLDLNIAPLAYDFKWSARKDIDMTRHGFEEGKNIYSAIGSMLRANMIWDFTDTFAWESRLYYNTSYKRVETEFENSLIFAFNRYFSTRVNVLLRYDDAVPLTPENRSRLQIYEMLTVGFDLKI
ncbi:DUF3078 domain-containing protein [Porphyromonas asaccharolytica]|uniref:DUF3078 domain-containing protein n=1 Tax=Porphyromonas asaccharolytica (strain ATCC 25260 / DSM 20707 / BCRC 10618 / CCUG 7834 / JCM 6326 / LMG 13178 / VPI 4198 / B440) TaxID=879243 RepID=F4KLG8_PORAD|nr:DUF3078 domain-containing protein [Porphyromonas asaccharolytica]AEE13116.1 hypothetical protein Poras_1174 [Porphyromonas asaccharolytica DSM 20707]